MALCQLRTLQWAPFVVVRNPQANPWTPTFKNERLTKFAAIGTDDYDHKPANAATFRRIVQKTFATLPCHANMLCHFYIRCESISFVPETANR